MKQKNIYLGIIIVIITLLIGIGIGYFLGNKKDTKDYEEFTFFSNDVLNNVKEKTNGYEITINNYYPINLYDYIDDTETYKNIAMTGFKLNGIESTLKIENLSRTANCVADKIFPKIILNGTVIEEFSHEACYLVFPAKVFIIEEKYLGILYYVNENMEQTIIIYNSEGIREYERNIVDIDIENFTFKDYEENDPNYYINEYKLVKKNNKIDDILVDEGKEQFCDMMNGIGICEE